MTFTTARTFPTTNVGPQAILAAVYEYERMDRKAMEAFAFMRKHGHTPEMHKACRNAQRRFDSWTAKIKTLVRTFDDAQLKALFDLCEVTPANLGL